MTRGIEITAATVWDDQQILRWGSIGSPERKVAAVFGCRQQQLVGHGRAPDDVPEASDEHIERHSALARSVGLEFLYLLNGRCEHLKLDDLEIQRRILDEVDWIVHSVRASCVVVADLRLGRLIRSRYPKEVLGIRVSTIAAIKRLKDLQPWLALDIRGGPAF